MRRLQVRSFYVLASPIAGAVSLLAITVSIQCPYKSACPSLYWALLLIAVTSAIVGMLMVGLDWSLTHVMRLSAADLAPERIKMMNTAKWGFVAKAFPPFSCWTFLLLGIELVVALILAKQSCPKSGNSAGEGLSCAAPWFRGDPAPTRDVAALCVPWLAIAVMGFCTQKGGIRMPHVYDPVREVEEAAKCMGGCAAHATRCCHP